jgi:hypothetical protein
MTVPVTSIHEYELAPGVDADRFETVVAGAERDGLFELPGLAGHRFLRGIKGDRAGEYAAVWTYESRAAWEALWGPPDDPVAPDEYPERWREWERRLAPLLTGDPDRIRFTSYRTVAPLSER